MKFKLTIYFIIISIHLFATQKNILFLGNSYTYVNNLPQMVADVALSVGDSMTFNSNTPGGYTLQGHSTNATSLSLIALGNWDFVVLQDQSQLPSFPDAQVETDVFPYAHFLDSMIHLSNVCTETVFYMTWGRKNGDATNCGFFTPLCTYEGMDSMLNLRYRMMADSNNALLSPVGAVRHYIRNQFPWIELYQSDESHPSLEGTYAAACTFYAALFRKDPELITNNCGLTDTVAAHIRNAARRIVFDSLLVWHIGEYDPTANFAFSISGTNELTITNSSNNSTFYSWDFGDGATDSIFNPFHMYLNSGVYSITLIASQCGMADSLTQTINVNVSGVNSIINKNADWKIYPNPIKSSIYLKNLPPGNITYTIMDSSGKIVRTGEKSELEETISTATLPSGFYFLQLANNLNFIGIRKFLKE